MKRNKLLILMVLMLLSVSILAGCSSNSNSNSTSGSKVEPLTILYPGDESERMTEYLDNEFAEKMETELGLKVKVIFVPWAQYWEQKDIMLAASEPVDLFWDGLPDLSTIVNKKQAQPLDSLIEKYGQDMLKVLPMEHLQGAIIDGQIYGIPSAYAPSSAMYQLVAVRQDILEAVGMTEVNTAEDLKEFATRAAKQYPEFKGPSDIIFKPLTRYFTDEQYNWIASEDLVVFGEDSKKAYSYFETEAFQKVAKFNNGMYDAGLYSEDLTIKYNERDTRMQTGLYLWVEGSLGKEMEIIEAVRANDPKAVVKTYLLADDKPRYITATGGEVLAVPATAPNPEGAMKFINWIYSSQENYQFALYGVEGKDFEIVDGRIKKITASEFFYEWMFRNKNYQLFGPDVDQASIDNYAIWDDEAILSDALGFRFNNEKVKNIETALREVAGKQLAAIRSGFVDFETGYPKAIEKLKAAGIDEYVAEVQRQLDEFLASK
ncbi:putative aldouronate transport system substrate-binding protein [Paenibacillus anaericanus]|uniref:ABC transporter substrate-binding protein n=1 Tax=Paenibacillus anaericanus TaxID=170367 RepID=UPI002787EB4D|nr:ABC transporter substrate-binding protein [Paenibacillus anaericanus]MDQ0090366.1 putative aldouronate transport system substrate-binding protein [Paenibacillus anaericanus]